MSTDNAQQCAAEETSAAQRIAIIQAMDAAWEKHSQPITLSVPTGCDSMREVKGGDVMGRLGFNLAVMAVIDSVIGVMP